MPFRHLVAPFTGDTSMAAFMLEQYLPFVRDDLGWTDNIAPSPGTNPYELWLHNGTSPAEEPYVFFRATTQELSIFTGTGVDLGEELYDQPGNPANCPNSSDFSDLLGNIQRQRHQMLTSLVPDYSAFWLFGDDAGSYVHCVLKVAERHYRHFWVGKLVPLVDGIDPRSFYVCGGYWDQLPGGGTMGGANSHRAPYANEHRPPHASYGGSTLLDSQKAQQSAMYYMPGLRSGIEFWVASPSAGAGFAVTKNVGTINTSYTLGLAQVSGYGGTFGFALFQGDESFVSGLRPLIPIQVFGSFSFDGAERIGPLCRIPDVYRVNMRNFHPEQEILIGSETYVVFPVLNMDSANIQTGEGYSGWEGLAYRKLGS